MKRFLLLFAGLAFFLLQPTEALAQRPQATDRVNQGTGNKETQPRTTTRTRTTTATRTTTRNRPASTPQRRPQSQPQPRNRPRTQTNSGGMPSCETPNNRTTGQRTNRPADRRNDPRYDGRRTTNSYPDRRRTDDRYDDRYDRRRTDDRYDRRRRTDDRYDDHVCTCDRYEDDVYRGGKKAKKGKKSHKRRSTCGNDKYQPTRGWERSNFPGNGPTNRVIRTSVIRTPGFTGSL